MLRKLIPALILGISLLGCSESSQTNTATPAESPSAQASEKGYSLLFFLNPNGGPCRLQDSILQGMGKELTDAVQLRPVQTNVEADLKTFYAFGIRGLPSLILVDASGKEIRRLPPGVRSAEEIRAVLQTL